MAKYISELQVSLNPDEEAVLEEKGFSKINVDLNQGSRDNKTFIWFKRGTEGISDIYLSFGPAVHDVLRSEGYTQIEKNLNPDSSRNPINLWYCGGISGLGRYIVELDVTAGPDEDHNMSSGWGGIGYELIRNRPMVYLWIKREIQPVPPKSGSAPLRLNISDVPDSPL